MLSGYALYREKVLAAALPHAENPKDAAELKALTSAPTQPISPQGLEGDWRCRSLQADSFGVFIYPFFKCRIAVDAAGRLMFQKTSGSQRSSGELLRHGDDRLLYIGAATVNDDPVKTYGESEDANVVGFLFQLGPRRLRLEMRNKGFEILELVK